MKFTIYSRVQFNACPTCQELCNNAKYLECYTITEECSLALCKFIMFEEKTVKVTTKKKIIEEPIVNDLEAYQDDSTEKKILTKQREVIHESVDDGVPLYLDMSEEGQKPKWTLVWGVGPQKLELDNSRSGRIYKPFLRQFGIKELMYEKESSFTKENFLFMSESVESAWRNTPDKDQPDLLEIIEKYKPCYANWKFINDVIAAKSTYEAE
jgi:hypothetical protein